MDRPPGAHGIGHHGDAVGRHDEFVGERQESEVRIGRGHAVVDVKHPENPGEPSAQSLRGFSGQPATARHVENGSPGMAQGRRLRDESIDRCVVEAIGNDVATDQHRDDRILTATEFRTPARLRLGDRLGIRRTDELDELFFGHNTRTYVWDVSDLDNPTLNGFHEHGGGNIDHNQYVTADGLSFQSNYTQGLRIMEITNPATASLTQVGFFDTFPENDAAGSFSGSWSNYPFFDSGIVLISDTTRGVFVVRPNLDGGGGIPCGDFDRFQARCQSGGRVQYRAILTDNSHDGETVTFQIDGGNDQTRTISNDRAQGQQTGFSLGSHTVTMSDPAGCFPERVVTCN